MPMAKRLEVVLFKVRYAINYDYYTTINVAGLATVFSFRQAKT